MLGLNFLFLNEEESNPWTPPITSKLISPSETPNTKTPKEKDIENLLNKLLRNLYEGTSDLRFRSDREENPFN